MTPQDYKRTLELRLLYQDSYQTLISVTESELTDSEVSNKIIIQRAFVQSRQLLKLIQALNTLILHYESINEGEIL